MDCVQEAIDVAQAIEYDPEVFAAEMMNEIVALLPHNNTKEILDVVELVLTVVTVVAPDKIRDLHYHVGKILENATIHSIRAHNAISN